MNFKHYLQQKGIVPHTIARHQREVDKYRTWLRAKGTTPENATKKELLDYLQYVKEKRNLGNATQNGVLQKLKNYHGYLAKKYGINNISSFIKIRGINRKHLRQLFTPDELELLCDAYYCHVQEYRPNPRELHFHPDHKKLLQGRYIALTLIAYQGLQVQEMNALTQTDFDLRKATVKVCASRKGAERKLPLDASQIGVLIQYYANGENTALIPNKNHVSRLSDKLKELTLKPSANITKFEDFRQIRASKIVQWIKRYGLRKAQHLAGHKNINSTEVYLANDVESLQNDMDSFHPLN